MSNYGCHKLSAIILQAVEITLDPRLAKSYFLQTPKQVRYRERIQMEHPRDWKQKDIRNKQKESDIRRMKTKIFTAEDIERDDVMFMPKIIFMSTFKEYIMILNVYVETMRTHVSYEWVQIC